MTRFDFIVIGSGIAGLSFALKAAELGSVAIVTKRARAESNTAWAQGGIASVTSAEDSFELHGKDTLEAGAGLGDEAVVRRIVTDGPARIRELIEFGVAFDERELPDGSHELDLAREGGHSKRRILHARDLTGREIERALLAAIERAPTVTVFENHIAVDLITLSKLGPASTDRCPIDSCNCWQWTTGDPQEPFIDTAQTCSVCFSKISQICSRTKCRTCPRHHNCANAAVSLNAIHSRHDVVHHRGCQRIAGFWII